MSPPEWPKPSGPREIIGEFLGDGKVIRGPSYSRASFDPPRLKKTAEWAAYQVRHLRADAIVVVGHSGLVMGGAVGLLTGVPVVAVRKSGDLANTHDNATVNAVLPHPAVRWVFLDDFVSSGATLRWAMEQVWYDGLVARPYPEAILAYASVTNNKSITKYKLDQAVPEYRGWPDVITQIGYTWEPGEREG